MSRPRAIAPSTYAKPSASVKANSCAAVEPASRIWYPDTEIVFQRGISRVQNSIMSRMIRTCGRGGKIHSFCAMYSLRMSAWSVPPSLARGIPLFSAVTMYCASAIAAGPLIVIEVVIEPRSIPSNSVSMSRIESIATPHRPTSPRACGLSESKPIKVGISKATESPICPCESRK